MSALDFPNGPTLGQIFTAPGGSPTYVWDGTAWVTVGQTIAGLIKISSGSLAAAAATIDIALPAGYPGGFELLLSNFVPVTDVQNLGLRFSADGTTFLATGYAWSINAATSAGANAPTGNGAGTLISLTSSQSNNAAARGHCKVNLPTPIASVAPAAYYLGHYWSGTNYVSVHGSGAITSGISGLAAAVRVLYSAGNIAAGTSWQLNGFR